MPRLRQQILTTDQAAVYLGVDQRTMRRWLEAGHLPSAVRTDGWAVLVSDVMELRRNPPERRRPGRPRKVTSSSTGAGIPTPDEP